MTPLENYVRELRDVRSLGAGVPETSYYPALSNLLNEVGKSLKPKVRCVINLANRGVGLPDGGLFTADQFPKKSPDKPPEGQVPSRGAIEVKPAKDDAWVTAESGQVTRYWNKYRQVLVTNYRDFVLVGQADDGKPVRRESFRLAADEKSFWAAAANSRSLDQRLGTRFVEFLRRVMLHAAPLAAPEDVAWFLASYAREALGRVESTELPALSAVRRARWWRRANSRAVRIPSDEDTGEGKVKSVERATASDFGIFKGGKSGPFRRCRTLRILKTRLALALRCG